MMIPAASLLVAFSAAASPSTAFVGLRGEGDVSASIEEVANVLADVEHESRWFDGVEEARILHTVSDSEYIMYAHLAAPMPLTDRGIVVEVNVSFDPSLQTLKITMESVEDPQAPRTSYVRALVSVSSFTLHANANGTTHVTAELHCDPQGNVPGWMVSSFQQSWGANTLKGLRRQVARREAPVEPRLRAHLSAPQLASAQASR